MNLHQPLPWLGHISAQVFMRDYWQKRPLFVKGAFRALFEQQLPLDEAGFRALCAHPELPVRLVRDSGAELTNGPLSPRQVPRPNRRAWAILIQQINTAVPEADAFLSHFRFIPDARLEDLMVSLAGPEGGIGPHVDSYDVFLIQAAGTRDWSIAEDFDPSFIEDIPLRVLANYEPEQVFQCEPGDLLYLPPNMAHHGIATSAGCMTYSVGFRAPDPVEIADEAVGHKLDALELVGWSDPWLKASSKPCEVPDAMMEAMIQAARQCLPTDAELTQSALMSLSRLHPGAHWPEAGGLSLRAFRSRLLKSTPSPLTLHHGTRLLQYQGLVAVNGEVLNLDCLTPAERRIMLQRTQTLALSRELAEPSEFWNQRSDAFIQIFHQLHQMGAVLFLSKSTRTQRTKKAMIAVGTE
ncbi:MAG: hypothetical protein RLY30_760 [Pseudomonadota bacterium]